MSSATTEAARDLLVRNDSGVVHLTINRPERRNALSLTFLRTLRGALDELRQDASARVIIIGSPGAVFCSGHDLGEMTDRSEADYRELFSVCAGVMQRLRQMPQPVIARVQGMATGAGCQLVAACDLAVASDAARFCTPGVKLGLFCTTPMVPLVRNIAPKHAMEMLLTGTPISAQRAAEIGLVNRVVPGDKLDEAVREFTDSILSTSGATVALGKQAFYNQLALDEPSAYDQAVCVMTDNAVMPDAQEGMSAFVQKRVPQWTHGK